MTELDSQHNQRKSIPKKIRFEVFKRDSFKCQYCGASAPETLLHVDHIKPISEGGTNDITNLITSCSPCNLGKSSRVLDDKSAIKKRKAQLDELQERREQLEMMMAWMEGLQDLRSQAAGQLADYWTKLAPGFSPNARGQQKLRKWLTKFSIEDVMKAMDIASAQYLEYQIDGRVTEQSWETAFNKIPPILNVERDSRDDPDLKELLYIRGIVRNKCERYFENAEALEWLRAARSWEIPMAELKQLAYGVRYWSHFVEQISALIEKYKVAQGG
jgi:HNH endonuclease